MAATRLYLSGINATVNLGAALTGGGIWESAIGTVVTKKLRLIHGATAPASNATVVGTGVNPNDILYFQGMSDDLPSGKLINGTFSGVAAARENSSINTNAFVQCGVFVVNAAGSLIATLIAQQTTGGTEFNNPSANNRIFPRGGAASVSPYTTVNATSRIVVELGIRIETTRIADTVSLYVSHDDSATDLPLGDGTDNSITKNPWVEFSVDLFAASASGVRSFAPVAIGYHEQTDDGIFVPDGFSKRRRGLVLQ